MESQSIISIIIPTKNSGETIQTCLASIRRQTHQNIEIILVDKYSSDDTKEIARKFGAIVIESGAARAEARNIGVRKALGKYILFLDSDMELSIRVIEECVTKAKEGGDAVIIPEVSVGVGFWANCKALEKSCYLGDDSIEASRFFKRSAFEGSGGYDPWLEAGEDWDLNQRIRNAGYQVERIDSHIRHHEGKLTLWKTIKKKHQYGKTIKQYERKHPAEARQQLKLIRPAFVKNWRKLVKDPLHALGMLFMKFCEFGAGWFGVVSVKSPN